MFSLFFCMPSVMSRSRERIGCWMEPNLSLDITSWGGGRREGGGTEEGWRREGGGREEGERREVGGREEGGRRKGGGREAGGKREGGRRKKKRRLRSDNSGFHTRFFPGGGKCRCRCVQRAHVRISTPIRVL